MLIVDIERINLPAHHADLFGSFIGGEKQRHRAALMTSLNCPRVLPLIAAFFCIDAIPLAEIQGSSLLSSH